MLQEAGLGMKQERVTCAGRLADVEFTWIVQDPGFPAIATNGQVIFVMTKSCCDPWAYAVLALQ